MGGDTAGWAGCEVDSCLGEGAGGSAAVPQFPREVAFFVLLDEERREGCTPELKPVSTLPKYVQRKDGAWGVREGKYQAIVNPPRAHPRAHAVHFILRMRGCPTNG